MVQYHDEPFALFRQFEGKGTFSHQRFETLLTMILDWNLFLAFNIIDGCTAGKSQQLLYWLFQQMEDKIGSKLSAADIQFVIDLRIIGRSKISNSSESSMASEPT